MEFDIAGIASACKDLAVAERNFRSIKATDIDIRPIHHRLDDRVRAHIFVWFLAAHLTFHLRPESAKKEDAKSDNDANQEARGFSELPPLPG